jgi:hypothetical protein
MGGKKGCRPELCPHGILGKAKCGVCVASRHKEYALKYPERCRAACARWRAKNRKHTRAYRRNQLGIPALGGEAPTGICPLCSTEKVLVPDHNHASGTLRGWLCGTCNRFLGFVERLRKEGRLELFEKYLEIHNG